MLQRSASPIAKKAAAIAAAVVLATALCAGASTAAAKTLEPATTAPAAKATASTTKTAKFKKAKFKESNKQLANPYRGWYTITAYTPTENDADNYVEKRLANDLGGGYDLDLVLVEINLKNYNGRNGNPTAIGPKGLAQVERVLSAWEEAGKHVILRLIYDSATTTDDDTSLDGDAQSVEPNDLATLKGHITQLAPSINAHKKCVYMVQGTSMGAWGEMHTSNFLPDIDGSRKTTHANIKDVLQHMGGKIDSSIFLAVRRPSYYRNTVSASAPTAKTAFKGSLAARVALFNDGMFGDASDSGTYDDSRKNEVAFQQKLCQYVPNGGEAITLGSGGKVTDWNRFSTTATGSRAKYGKSLVDDMRAMHVSYLNCEWHTSVLGDWKNANFAGKGVYNGLSGKDYIERHLGYRYVLRSAKATTKKSKTKVAFTIENVGFSPAYRPMTSKLSLVNKKGKVVKSFTVKSDNRLWSSGAKKKLSKTISLKKIPRGTYTLRYSLTDKASGKQIALANTGKRTATGYALGTLKVK